VRRFILAGAFVLAGGCLGAGTAVAPSLTPTPTQAGATRVPQDLPRLSEEGPVIATLGSVGFRVDRIAASKFEGYLLGDRAPHGRVFVTSNFRTPGRVDVLFPEEPVSDVRVCPGSGGDPYSYAVYIDDQPISSAGSTAEVFFASGPHFFVLASDRQARDALRDALGLAIPGC
jgi:hypothetical protein